MLPIYAYSKGIKDTNVSDKEINDARDISKIDGVIKNLESVSGVREDNLSDIGLRTNPKNWIEFALRDGHNNEKSEVMKNLLFDFTESMQTRMREDFKYALIIRLQDRLVLCHSKYGQQTITPEWKTIPRMLDVDNILRFVIFTRNADEINVKYWEQSATNSFMDWLGLSRKQVFQFGGKFRILSEFDGISLEFQLNEDELEKWLEDHPEFSDGEIKFENPIRILKIQNVKVGSKQYSVVMDFIQDFEAEKYGIPLYQQEYERIIKDNLPLLVKYYDEETSVIRIEGDKETTIVSKDTPDFDIIFANEFIKLRASYCKNLASKVLNKETLRIFHAGMKFNSEPCRLGNLQIFNALQKDLLSNQLITYYNQINIQDENLDIIILFIILKVLSIANIDYPIEAFLNSIADEIIKQIKISGCITKTEDVIIEYKSREIFMGKDSQIISSLVEEINSKHKDKTCKIFIIGIEDDGEFDPIPNSRLSSDRLETIKNGIQHNVPNVKLFPFQIRNDNVSLLVIVVF